MLDVIDLEDCLRELPLIDSFSMWSTRNVEMPVRSIEPVGSVYDGPLEPPAACIYRATFSNGTTREILVNCDGLHRLFDAAFFLKEGREGDKLHDIAPLIIEEDEERVPQSLKDAIRDYEAQRTIRNAKLKLG